MNKPTDYAEQTDRIRALTELLALTTISGGHRAYAEIQQAFLFGQQPISLPAAGDTVVTGKPDDSGNITP